MFNLYGSAWSQGRRSYAPVRTPSGALSGVGEPDPEKGGAPISVEGGVKASDCHRLLRDHMASPVSGLSSMGEVLDGEGAGDVEPR